MFQKIFCHLFKIIVSEEKKCKIFEITTRDLKIETPPLKPYRPDLLDWGGGGLTVSPPVDFSL